MTAEPITYYRVHFPSGDALSTARARLQEAGFVVTPVTDEAPHALDASIGAEEEDAAVRVQRALDGIGHDPLIDYQVVRLESFSR